MMGVMTESALNRRAKQSEGGKMGGKQKGEESSEDTPSPPSVCPGPNLFPKSST